MSKFLDSQTEFAAFWTSIGVVISATLSGLYTIRSRRIEKQIADKNARIADENAKVAEKKVDLEYQAALMASYAEAVKAFEVRIAQLNDRVKTLEEEQVRFVADRDALEARVRAAEAVRDTNLARIRLLEVEAEGQRKEIERQRLEIEALQTENKLLAERLRCEVRECPFLKVEGAKEETK